MSANQTSTPVKKGDACPFILSDNEPKETLISENDSKNATCPFDKAKEDAKDMMHQNGELKTEYEVKINSLNRLLPETQQKKGQEFLSDPQLAFAMKEGTKVVHTAAEDSIFTKRFLSGAITKDEYGRYINSLYFVYKTMERLLTQYKDHPTIQMVYFPYELNREKALLKDIEYYYGKDRVAELTSDSNITPAVQSYIKTLQDAADKNPSLLIAHSYSRYLGDLSGGQILAKRLKKYVLKIDVTDAAWDSYHGLEFYNFDHIANNNEFKNLYRQRLDGARVTQYTKDLIIAEAIYSFELNIALFDEIQALSEAKKLHATLNDNDTYTVASERSVSKYAPSADWFVGFATGALTLAVGLSVYNRISERL
ncbi:heme oxygenase-domain-containing protein [Mucor mucedo]|uniref:heme oxygenase-domain-containing protein n=1 Tax=Mucor mucedo TaxID=29922 RepID=UPI00221E5168|nr:heme oxygenase-domain-containing protein [Mucor mucedo]KAI7894229.1 heme oxygenase-domain-containing protein [Mucor mucedo]